MKKTLLSLLLISSVGIVSAQETPMWLRQSAISPDGTTVAFCYKGDIFTVPTNGGKAQQITMNPAYDTKPVWSPDGKTIAFASNRENSFDIYTISKDGGIPKRITTYEGNVYPQSFLGNDTIIYMTMMMPSAEYSQFPGSYAQLYSVSLNGGRPELYSSHPMENISFNKDKSLVLFHDKKGYEDEWRKHHVSSITRDIWSFSPQKNEFKKITSFEGEDRNPVFAQDGDSFYYLSEKDGSFNVYKSSVSSPSNITKLTSFTKNPVRYLSISDNGTMLFSYDGELYTMTESSEPKKIDIKVYTDQLEKENQFQRVGSGARDLAVSPNGKEVAFIIRGDVYVTSMDYATTKRITNSAEQERDLSFGADGRSLYYSSERGGIWNIYKTDIVKKEDKTFTYASEIKEEPVTKNNTASFQPVVSPDGKYLAYLQDRTTLNILDLKSGKSKTVLGGEFNYSYSDGDQWFSWSPDSKWLLCKYIGVGGWNNVDIALVNAESGELTNLTESGYSDGNGKWVLDGKAMMWSSDKAGYRSHGSWGSQSDIYIMFFDDEAYNKFTMSKEELELWNEADKEYKKEQEKKEKEKAKDEKKKEEGEVPVEKVKAIELELSGRKNRTLRLTRNSSNLGDSYLSQDGTKLYYTNSFEGGADLWVQDLKDGSLRILIKGLGAWGFIPNKEGNALYMLSNGGIKKVDIPAGSQKNIAFNTVFEYKPAQERNYIFEHAWQQVKDKFYDKNIHGIDWEGYKKTYEKFLPYINNNFDYTEMLGELNGSHTGARYRSGSSNNTGFLGAFYDENYKGDGLKIKEVITRGPLALAMPKVEAGAVIEKIDGKEIKANDDYMPLLYQKIGTPVILTIKSAKGKREDIKIKPISLGQQNGLLYNRWVEQRRDIVEKLSNGRLGYIHIKGMDSESFRETYSDLLGKYRNKEAIIIDTRHNGGGWLHDDLVTLLNGKVYQQFAPRGQFIGNDPFNKWTKPSCVIICEDNYSNAHGFPWVYKELKIGKLIGAPIPGTMTAVWWESQIDPSIVFGIPQVGCRDMRGNYLENQLLMPDIEVYNDPKSMLEGKDLQLEAAVKEMLQEADANKTK
ncbi:MAG: S41 family peptidase [Bacteroidales bacterium]|nr:S41 family peptidase [Bacteroidales bacterium]